MCVCACVCVCVCARALSVNVLCNTPYADFRANDTFVRIVRANGDIVHTALVASQQLRFNTCVSQLSFTRFLDMVVRVVPCWRWSR